MPAVQLDRLELLGRATRDGATFDGGDVLVGVKAENHQVPEAADAPPAPDGADRVRGVLDDAQPVLARDGVQPLHVHRQAGEMHRQDGAGARCDRRRHLVQIDVARVQSHVHEHRAGAHAHDDVGGGHEAQRRRDDFIALADATGEQRHLEARRRGGLGAHRPSPEIARQLSFELRDLWSARQPARAQHLGHRLDRLLIDARARKGQHPVHLLARIIHERATSTTPSTMMPIPATRWALGTSPRSHQARPTLMT